MFVRVSPCVVPPSISKQCHPRHGNILSPPWNPMEVTRVLSEECMPGMPHCTPWLIIIFRFPMKLYETCHKWWGPPCILDHFGFGQLAWCLWVFARNPRLPEFPTNHALKSLVWPALSCEDNLLVSNKLRNWDGQKPWSPPGCAQIWNAFPIFGMFLELSHWCMYNCLTSKSLDVKTSKKN